MFYDKYAKLCHDNGTSPTEAAINMGLSNAAPTNWVHGATPRRSTVVKIAAYFGVSPSYFDEEQETPPVPESGTEGKRAKINQVFDSLSEAGQEEALRYAQYIAAREAAHRARPD